MTRFWVCVVHRSHVKRGVAGGFAQVCHGKETKLRRMQEGDWLVYYSPKEDMSKASKAVQCFTAIGRVVSAKPYQVQMTDDFNPFRVEVQYVPGCHDAAAVPLVGQMQVFSGKHKTRWGLVMRRGHFEIPEGDFRLVAEAMNADLGRLGGDRAAT